MEKLGLDYSALKAEQPEPIYCSLNRFLAGPYEHRTALDEMAQMMGRLAYMTGGKDRPLRAGAFANDVMVGWTIAFDSAKHDLVISTAKPDDSKKAKGEDIPAAPGSF